MKQKKLFIASTGKDVGKTTLCLGLIDYLNKTCGPCGFMKPVGQDQLINEGLSLDKDAVLIKHYFKLKESQSLSPVSIPQGFTKEFLDGKINKQTLTDQILNAQNNLSCYNSIIYEGTGHLGVGSIIDLNNAQVAQLLQAPILLVTKGGIGSSFDELMLNLALCRQYNLTIAGVVLNKVIPEKLSMIAHYFQKALSKINIPYLGALPFDLLLAKPTFKDLAHLLKTPIYQGHDMGLKHVENMLIIASHNQVSEIHPYNLVIMSAEREGLIHELIHQASLTKTPLGLILTGQQPPSAWICKELEKTPHFVMITSQNSQDLLIELSNFHAKIQAQDSAKIKEAIDLVHKHINLNLIS